MPGCRRELIGNRTGVSGKRRETGTLPCEKISIRKNSHGGGTLKITRRKFLEKTTVCTAGSALTLHLGSLAGPAFAGTSRPNIILFVADDLGKRELGCYGQDGSPVVDTPEINTFADQGIRFNNYITASTLCAPTRAALVTGLHSFRSGSLTNFNTNDKSGVQTLPDYLPSGYRKLLFSKSKDPHMDTSGFTQIDSSISFLEADDGISPFFLWINVSRTHRPWTDSGPYTADDIIYPPYLVDTPETRESVARYYNAVRAFSRDNFGNIIGALDGNQSIRDNTVVIFTADQGPQVTFSKWTLYEAGVNVPLLVRWPGVVGGGSVSDALISQTDILPTVVDIAGGTPPSEIDGRSFVPVLLGDTSTHHEEVFCQHTNQRLTIEPCYPIRAIRTNRYKYIRNLYAPEQKYINKITLCNDPLMSTFWCPWLELAEQGDEFAQARVQAYESRPCHELYDLQNDPWELNNLADNPDYEHVVIDLRQKLELWREQMGDPELTGPVGNCSGKEQGDCPLPSTGSRVPGNTVRSVSGGNTSSNLQEKYSVQGQMIPGTDTGNSHPGVSVIRSDDGSIRLDPGVSSRSSK
ncbi:MAG: sulfatase-like hydrolase/transferase [Chitinivibrionales bacterium]|nr:sulfatase-like hydrolase/transferase [Chitinivibrionales bacterium]